jgi:predicted SprT family Zn-dependent metalloprotease
MGYRNVLKGGLMKFVIPSKFQLGGTTINVLKVKQITNQSKECDGMAFYAESKIELDDDEKSSDDYKEYVFFHELVHHIFYQMAEDSMRKNEKITAQFATFLHQAIKTME